MNQGSYRLGRVKFKDFQDHFISKFKDQKVEKKRVLGSSVQVVKSGKQLQAI